MSRFLAGYAWYWRNIGRAIGRLLHPNSFGHFLKRSDQLLAAILGWNYQVTLSWGIGYWLIHGRPLGRLLGPVVDLIMLLPDGLNHSVRTARDKPRPPKGPGVIYFMVTLMLTLLVVL